MEKFNVLILLIMMVVVLLTTACASNPVLVPKYSDALNIMRTEYPTVGLRDVSYEKYLKTKEKFGKSSNGDTLATETLALTVLDGFDPAFFGSGILDSFGKQNPQKTTHFLIWMPVEDSKVDKKAAGDKMYNMLRDAIIKAARSVYGKDWVIQPERTFLPDKKYDAKKFSPIRLSREGEEFYLLFSSSRGIYKPKVKNAPDFLGNVKSYIWNRIDGFNNFYLVPHTCQRYKCMVEHRGLLNSKECRRLPKIKGQPDLRLYQETSRNMPCWFFVYVAPGKSYLNSQMVKYPVVFNQGKEYFFIEPSPEKRKDLSGRLINGTCKD